MTLLHQPITESILGAFYEVYYALGYGFLERPYANALVVELRLRGHHVQREIRVPVRYKGVVVGRYQIDIVVDEKVLVEVKSGPTITNADHRQLLNYLQCTEMEVGLLLHFGRAPRFHRTIWTRDHRTPTPSQEPSAPSAPSAHFRG